MINITDIEITKEDHRAYPYHTDNSIIGRKFIASFSDDELQQVLDDEEFHESIRVKIGVDTNPRWVSGEVLGAMYERELIDELEHEYLCRQHSCD